MPDARAVVSDDGLTISLTAYAEDGAAVPVALSPMRAIAIADELEASKNLAVLAGL